MPTNMKKTHWHIDYFLAEESVLIKKVIMIPSIERIECAIARQIEEQAIGNIGGFGCSDCNCASHLFYFGEAVPFEKTLGFTDDG
jgi:Uri superfamily endonuclease